LKVSFQVGLIEVQFSPNQWIRLTQLPRLLREVGFADSMLSWAAVILSV
jgi:hypothetical protein